MKNPDLQQQITATEVFSTVPTKVLPIHYNNGSFIKTTAHSSQLIIHQINGSYIKQRIIHQNNG